jgi:hypothetical protein
MTKKTVGVMIALAIVGWFVLRSVQPRAIESLPLGHTRADGRSANAPQLDDPGRDPALADSHTLDVESAATETRSTASGATLVVRVIDRANGAPVAGVRARAATGDLQAWSQHVWREVDGSHGALDEAPVTDAAGRCEIQVPSGEQLMVDALSLEGDGQSEQIPLEPLEIGDVREIVIQMSVSDAWVVCVRVLDAANDQPIAGARLRAVGEYHSSRGDEKLDLLRMRTTGADGRGRVLVNPFTAAHVRVDAEGFSPQLVVAHSGFERPEHALVVRMARPATLRVHVERSGFDVPASAGVRLSASFQAERDLSGPIKRNDFSALVDENGLAVLEGLPAGILLQAQVDGFKQHAHVQTDPIVLSSGEVREVTWTLAKGCRLEGDLLDQGDRPVANTWLGLERASTDESSFASRDRVAARESMTDASGHFVFDDVPAGSWVLGALTEMRNVGMERRTNAEPLSAEAEKHAVQPVRVTIVPGATSQHVEVRTDRGLAITGRVLDADDKPIDHADVSTGGLDGVSVKHAGTDGSGEFVLSPLPAGTFTLTALAPGSFRSVPVTATAGERGAVLRLQPSCAINGIVVGANGEPRSMAEVLVVALNAADMKLEPRTAGFDGRFEIRDLAPGSYAVFASDQRDAIGVTTNVQAKVGETRELRVVLERGAYVRVSYAGARDEIGFEVRHEGRLLARSSAFHGLRREILVPSGTISIASHGNDPAERFERTITIGPGETQDVNLP